RQSEAGRGIGRCRPRDAAAGPGDDFQFGRAGMRQIYRMFGAVIVAAAMQSAVVGLAFAQGAPAGQGATAGASAQGDQGGAAGPSGATRPLEMPVLYVTGI